MGRSNSAPSAGAGRRTWIEGMVLFERQDGTNVRRETQTPEALQAGAPVKVFSHTAGVVVDAEVMDVRGDQVRVEYEIGTARYGKTMHVHSKDLVIPSAIVMPDMENA